MINKYLEFKTIKCKIILALIASFLILNNSAHAKSANCENIQNYNKDNIERSKLLLIGEVIQSKKVFLVNVKKNWRSTENKFEIKNPEINTDATGFPYIASVRHGDKVLILSTFKNNNFIELGACDPIILKIKSQQHENNLTEEINRYLGQPKYERKVLTK